MVHFPISESLIFVCTCFVYGFLLLGSVDLVHSEPIIISKWTFNHCQQGQSRGFPAVCCPPKPIRQPVLDFKPRYDPSKPLRVRKALQCLQGKELQDYLHKLQKGYTLMKALPYSDPRSLKRQQELHCAYGTSSLLQSPGSNKTIDVHWNWLFLPFHRAFVYFHEQILQNLLNDDQFTLHFWNFDSTVGEAPPPSDCGCSKPGHFFPPTYNDPHIQTFEVNRSSRTREPGRLVDLSWDVRAFNQSVGAIFQNYTTEEQIFANRATLHGTIITAGNTTRGFFGKEFRVGGDDSPQNSSAFEVFPHTSIHFWVGGLHSLAQTGAGDPLFYPLHANVERLWTIWRTLDDKHLDPTHRDWLEASFLFWDGEGALRRVRVKDLVDTKRLGYVYEKVNDNSWVTFNPPAAPAT